MSNNSKTVQDRTILITADQYEVVHDPSISANFNDPDFKVTPIFNAEYVINGTSIKEWSTSL